jgi:hypothetical protein
MSPFKLSLIAALLSAAVTAGGFHYFQQSRAREAGRLQAQNSRMLAEVSRRQQARVAGTRSVVPAPVAATSSGAVVPPATATTTAAGKPAEYYRNEGNATPLATLQTFAWACDRGDIETVGRLLHIDEAARPKAEAFMAALPESAREQWKTVDEMAAAVLTRSIMASPFPNSDILATASPEPVSVDRVRLRLPDVPKDGTEYQKTAEGWKYVLTETVVDAYISQASAQAGPVR